MTRSILVALVLALGGTAVSAQTSDDPPRPMNQWQVTKWDPESQAACGSFLTRFAYVLAEKDKSDKIQQMLFRGVALDALSKTTNPELNEKAWAAEIDLTPGQIGSLLAACTTLSNFALDNGMIPEAILDIATIHTIEILNGEI